VDVVAIADANRRRANVAVFDVILKNDTAAVDAFKGALSSGNFKVTVDGKELQVGSGKP
jgi:hypothetical protein